MTLPDALNVLKLRDLSLFFIYEKDSDEEENTVISQKPAENTEISTNSSVGLTVPASSGRRYKVSGPINLTIPKDGTSRVSGLPEM